MPFQVRDFSSFACGSLSSKQQGWLSGSFHILLSAVLFPVSRLRRENKRKQYVAPGFPPEPVPAQAGTGMTKRMPEETVAERGESPSEAAGFRGLRGDTAGGSEAREARPAAKRSEAGGLAEPAWRQAAARRVWLL